MVTEFPFAARKTSGRRLDAIGHRLLQAFARNSPARPSSRLSSLQFLASTENLDVAPPPSFAKKTKIHHRDNIEDKEKKATHDAVTVSKTSLKKPCSAFWPLRLTTRWATLASVEEPDVMTRAMAAEFPARCCLTRWLEQPEA